LDFLPDDITFAHLLMPYALCERLKRTTHHLPHSQVGTSGSSSTLTIPFSSNRLTKCEQSKGTSTYQQKNRENLRKLFVLVQFC